jgi:hypothetical protein
VSAYCAGHLKANAQQPLTPLRRLLLRAAP